MATNDPFVRVYFESHDPELHIEGGLFYLHTASNQSHLAAVSTGVEPANLTYEASPDFVAKYSEVYPIGHTLVWDNKDSFSAWLDSLIYYSFLISRDQGVSRPWFVKEIPAPNAYQLTGVPIGFERFFNEEYDTFWILLKSGNRVWPVRIINNNFRDNWSSFLKDHGVGPNFKIVFGCYKKWIFDVYVLNTSLERVMQRWNIGGNFLEQLIPEDYITETSCVPYTMLTEFRFKQFGCMCISKDQIKQVFEQNLNQLMRDGELRKVVLKTGPREWHIPLRHSSIRHRNFVKFLYEHSLRQGDFILLVSHKLVFFKSLCLQGMGVKECEIGITEEQAIDRGPLSK